MSSSLSDWPKQYNHTEFEETLYQEWEDSGAFTPKQRSQEAAHQKPFSILMPPPNANASLHAGHAMYVIQDILVRYHRMLGEATAWFPGTDHAGFETQFVYEKHLKKQGTSRFQFDRETLYQDIKNFVQENSGLIENQMRRLGFSADWSQKTFTLDEKVINIVFDTFQKMANDGLLYRDNYLVNYCPKCGTTFADLEIMHEERISPLHYVKYRFSDGEPRIVNGQEMMYLVVATVRPETIFADAAIAIHPEDPRAKDLVGEYVLNPLTKEPIPVIADEYVNPEFGTGMLKITPAHDPNDFILGKKHNLPINATVNTFGKITLDWWSPTTAPTQARKEQLELQFQNKAVNVARTAVSQLLQAENSMEKIDEKYQNNVTVCYKLKHDIEPLPYPNWFVKMESLAELGLEAYEKKEVNFFPDRFGKQYQEWLSNIRDWPISRQIVWGIRIPVWYNAIENQNIFVSFLDDQKERHNTTVEKALASGHTLETIQKGLQSLIAPMGTQYVISQTSPGDEYVQETDTFDTWFSSGQWPLVVLGYPDQPNFKQFYPTSVLDTMWDILFFWVARMIMIGKYRTGTVPFKDVYLHSMVTDEKGAKMSKSKGNVINPLEFVEKYGADSLRIALVAGSAPGNPIALSEAKVKGYRNFGNKIWNIGRFIWMQETELSQTISLQDAIADKKLTEDDTQLLKKLEDLTKNVSQCLDSYRFSDAALQSYDFVWNEFANGYLERNKQREDGAVYVAVIRQVLERSLHLLHPFMPFVTEAVWQHLCPEKGALITQTWPK